MGSIIGLNGLDQLSKLSNIPKLLLMNKKSIICGWNLINRELTKYKTTFVPVDSEHFSIWYALKNTIP